MNYSCVTTENENYKSIDIKTNEYSIVSNFYPARNLGPGVLLLSQCDPKTDQSEYHGLALELQKEGFSVLSYDYPGFGKSGGSKPNFMNFNSMDEVMQYWRLNWIKDVDRTFNTLREQDMVNSDDLYIIGASCGHFLALEYALQNKNVKGLVLLGGPIDTKIISNLKNTKSNIPILIIAGNEGQTFEWIDTLFSESKHPNSAILKYNHVLHGTQIFKKEPISEHLIVNWLKNIQAL